MLTLNQKIIDLSQHLQTLTKPDFSSDVQAAAKKEDKEALLKICKRANIPSMYVSNVVSIILSVAPQKWTIEI